MKKLLLQAFLLIAVFANAQFYMNSSGYLSLGSTSSAMTYVQSYNNHLFSTASSGSGSAAYIQAANGYSSASTPDYTWWYDNHTGIYHPNPYIISFSSDYSERFEINDSSGGQVKLIVGWEDINLDYAHSDGGGIATIYPQDNGGLELGNSTHFLADCYIAHELYETAPSLYSDYNIKQNINYTLDSALILVNELKPASFNYKPSFYKGTPTSEAQKYYIPRQYGFIAQDVQQILPELVSKDSATGLLSLNYIAFIPLLVKGVQVQQAEISELKRQLDSCCNINSRSGHDKTTNPNSSQGNNSGSTSNPNTINGNNIINNNTLQATQAVLMQNIPNPWSQTTTISCYIPDGSNNASIIIFDMAGTLKKTLPINGSEQQSIVINGGQLTPGMYLYTLIIDNKEIDTKKMILTQ